MHIHLLKSLEELTPYAEDWDRLSAGVPFRSWTWLSHWWRCYGPTDDTRHKSQLAVLAVFDEANALVGVAPWYCDYSLAHGRVLHMLGSGEVCSDYLSLLCHRGSEESLARAVADFLLQDCDDQSGACPPWDLISLGGVDFEDPAVKQLTACLAERGCTVHQQSNLNCWRLDLPAAWEEYLQTLSKSFQRQIRRLERDNFNTQRAVLRVVQRLDDLPKAMDLLIDMHQRRRKSLGEPGCFASPRFMAFFRSVLPQLMKQGQLQFSWLELDGRVVAAEYDLIGGGVLYAYQAGIDPEAMEFQPGKLLNLAILRRAIEQGYRIFDFLRGDEPYKAHFRAAPRPSLELRIVPPRPAPRLRHTLWQTGRQVKQWIKKGIRG